VSQCFPSHREGRYKDSDETRFKGIEAVSSQNNMRLGYPAMICAWLEPARPEWAKVYWCELSEENSADTVMRRVIVRIKGVLVRT
jgi:hypothetical protein